MVWLWGVVVGIAIGLPAATLALLTVRRRRGPRLNRIDRWLYDRYRLEWQPLSCGNVGWLSTTHHGEVEGSELAALLSHLTPHRRLA